MANINLRTLYILNNSNKFGVIYKGGSHRIWNLPHHGIISVQYNETGLAICAEHSSLNHEQNG